MKHVTTKSFMSVSLMKMKRVAKGLLDGATGAPAMRQVINRVRTSILSILPNELFAKVSFAGRTGRVLNLRDPVTFADKVWWLKFNYKNNLLTQCADKYLAREYVREKGLERLLIPLYGVYEDPDDIDFNKLPKTDLFFKTTHGSGGNQIVDNSTPSLELGSFRRDFKKLLSENYYRQSREWPYKGIVPRIVCEAVMRNEDGSLPADWKLYCFGGEPRFIYYTEGSSDRFGRHTSSAGRFANMYDLEFNLLPFERAGWRVEREQEIEPPSNLSQMIECARVLSRPFPFCRVDFYVIRGKLYFGEITFSPGGGNIVFQPDWWNAELGSWIDLSSEKLKCNSSGQGKSSLWDSIQRILK